MYFVIVLVKIQHLKYEVSFLSKARNGHPFNLNIEGEN